MSALSSNAADPTPIHMLGRMAVEIVEAIGDLVTFFLRMLGGMLVRWPRARVLWPVMYEIGVQSVPVIFVTGLFIGMVLAVQSYDTLRMFRLESRIGSIINVSLVRELGPVLAATMLAGRVGSAMAAEIGTMRVTEQIEALKALGADPLTYVVVDELHMTYTGGVLATTIVPLMIMPLAIPLWARLMERTHIITFRSIHGWAFVSASVAITLASYFHSEPFIYAGAVLLGIGFAGGTLAWNLGHQDFAPAERDSEYMAVHVTLNGIRGVLAPIASWWLYQLLAPKGYGALVLVLCSVINTIGVLGFMSMRGALRANAEATTAA